MTRMGYVVATSRFSDASKRMDNPPQRGIRPWRSKSPYGADLGLTQLVPWRLQARRTLHRASRRIDLPPRPISRQQFLRLRRQHPADFAPLPLHARDRQVLICGRPMSHPGDHRCLGALLNRDSLGARHRSAADRRGVLGHRAGEGPGKLRITGVKRQIVEHRLIKHLHVIGLLPFPPPGVGLALLGVLRRRALGGKILRDPFDRGAPRPQTPCGETSCGLCEFLDCPRRPRRLDPARQPRIARRKQYPIMWDVENLPVLCTNRAGVGAGGDDADLIRHGDGLFDQITQPHLESSDIAVVGAAILEVVRLFTGPELLGRRQVGFYPLVDLIIVERRRFPVVKRVDATRIIDETVLAGDLVLVTLPGLAELLDQLPWDQADVADVVRPVADALGSSWKVAIRIPRFVTARIRIVAKGEGRLMSRARTRDEATVYPPCKHGGLEGGFLTPCLHGGKPVLREGVLFQV